MFQIVNFPSQRIFYLSVTKVQYGRFSRVRVTINATAVAAQVIIARFIDFIDIVQLPEDDGLIGYLEQHIVLILQGLHLLLHLLLSLAELLDSGVALD